MVLQVGAIKDAIKIVEKTPEEIEVIKGEVQKSGLPPETITVLMYGLNLISWLPKLILEQKVTISRLKELLFGKKQRKEKIIDDSAKPKDDDTDSIKDAESTSIAAANEDDVTNTENKGTDPQGLTSDKTSKGHGRIPHTAYSDAEEHQITIDDLKAGMPCPSECKGRLYQFNPATIIRIKGQQMAGVHRYTIEKLRCNLCSEIISANLPESVGKDKYDANFKAQIGIQKYFMGIPSYRQATYHAFINVPLPHTTQWKLIEELAGCVVPIFNKLCIHAANNKLIYFDDTPLKIVDEIKDNRTNPNKKRKGMYTTGVLAKSDNHQIILYFNGLQHAGENLSALLAKRTNKKPAILMCDALGHNTPAHKNIVLCYCLSHGFRKFEELHHFFPEPCKKVMTLISAIYQLDNETTEMTSSNRLAHHKKYSTPIAEELHTYLSELIENKYVEPNCPLGKSVNYMLKHWHQLTQFLRVEGAPLDNNDMEQGLKIPIRGRKNWLFYKNTYGASIGGVLTSVIYTCMLSGVNPLKYLVAIQENKEQVLNNPELWLPWCYQDALSALAIAA